jgi:SAM-dependent methyltransferase
MGDAYEVTAEFYDLLQATQYLETAKRLLGRWLGEPRVGILDVGAGTGLATALLARLAPGGVMVHAIEPSAAMRAVLLSRLAGRPTELSRVRVHAKDMEHLGLRQVADFAWCLNTMASLDTAARAAALTALARAVVPGGTLVLQRPPAKAGPPRRDLPSWELGGDRYTGEVLCVPAEPGTVEWTFVYRVCREGSLIRQEKEVFTGYLASAAEFGAQLDDAGFVLVDADKPDVVIAKRKA